MSRKMFFISIAIASIILLWSSTSILYYQSFSKNDASTFSKATFEEAKEIISLINNEDNTEWHFIGAYNPKTKSSISSLRLTYKGTAIRLSYIDYIRYSFYIKQFYKKQTKTEIPISNFLEGI